MKILCITHADFETAGVNADWAKSRGHSLSILKPYKGEPCPSQVDFDFLIVMGGPQSPLKIELYPYLKDEIELIRTTIAEDKVILGFCLGAQLVGEALGAKAERSPEKEVGVYPITLTDAGKKDLLLKGFSSSFPVIHWHNDMPGETAESAVLAYSKGCPRQIVRYGSKIYGFQCHLEITHAGIKNLLAKASPKDLAPSRFTQSREELLAHDYSAINESLMTILDRLSASAD